MQCVNCGGEMLGDGYTCAYVCENAEDCPEIDCAEPDSGPWYCDHDTDDSSTTDLYVWKSGDYSQVLNADLIADLGDAYVVVNELTTFGELAKLTPQQQLTITSLMQGKEV